MMVCGRVCWSQAQMMEVDLYARFRHEVEQAYPGVGGRRAISRPYVA